MLSKVYSKSAMVPNSNVGTHHSVYLTCWCVTEVKIVWMAQTKNGNFVVSRLFICKIYKLQNKFTVLIYVASWKQEGFFSLIIKKDIPLTTDQ